MLLRASSSSSSPSLLLLLLLPRPMPSSEASRLAEKTRGASGTSTLTVLRFGPCTHAPLGWGCCAGSPLSTCNGLWVVLPGVLLACARPLRRSKLVLSRLLCGAQGQAVGAGIGRKTCEFSFLDRTWVSRGQRPIRAPGVHFRWLLFPRRGAGVSLPIWSPPWIWPLLCPVVVRRL